MNIHFVLWKCCQQLLYFPFSIIQVLGFPSWIFLPRKIHTWRKKTFQENIFQTQPRNKARQIHECHDPCFSVLPEIHRQGCELLCVLSFDRVIFTCSNYSKINIYSKLFFFISVHSEESSESMPLLFITSKRTLDTQWNLNIPSSFLSSVYPKFISLSKNELWHDQL